MKTNDTKSPLEETFLQCVDKQVSNTNNKSRKKLFSRDVTIGLITVVALALFCLVVFPKGLHHRTVPNTISGHKYVDLGLSVKWATCNAGASFPEEYGYYLAWAETEPKSSYGWENTKYCEQPKRDIILSKYNIKGEGIKDGKTRLDLSDDAANSNWGGTWRIPTKEEWEELNMKCKWKWTNQNGHEGFTITGENGNSIFLPAAGVCYGKEPSDVGYTASYWSSTMTDDSYNAYSLRMRSRNAMYSKSFSEHDRTMSTAQRCQGSSVRPVSE